MIYIFVWCCALAAGAPENNVAASAPAKRPNILWITCEDISPLLGCYGDQFSVTPNLDRLAGEGVLYSNAFAVASVCSPSRSCLITGVYPSSLGTQHLRSTLRLPRGMRCFTAYLRDAGYYCSNNVKEDYNFKTPSDAWDESSRQAHWRKRRPGQPFFSVFNLTCTHQGQIRLADAQFRERTARLEPGERHDPAGVPLPPYYPDTPVIRRDLARLYDLITAMDKQVGDLLQQLKEDRLDDKTIVFFYSDHGNGLPRHKRWLYDSGIRVPLIIRFPQKLKYLLTPAQLMNGGRPPGARHRSLTMQTSLAPDGPGSTLDRLVSFVDFAPTVLSLAGCSVPEYMQGEPFLGPQAVGPRDHVFAIRDRVDEVYELSRAVRDERYLYIRNYMPHRPVMQLSWYSEQTPTRQELRRMASKGLLTGPQAVLLQPEKPIEELYDAYQDPHMIRNLAGSPEYRGTLERLRSVLRQWSLDTRDTGFLHEAEMHRRAGAATVWDMAQDFTRYPLAEIMEAADLMGRGVQARQKMMRILEEEDASVRFWAASALGTLGPESAPAAGRLTALLGDSSPTVRSAAAEALCRLDSQAVALPILVQGLTHEDGWVRLHAANSLQYLGKIAWPVRPQIEDILEQGEGQAELYVRWGLSHLLDDPKP